MKKLFTLLVISILSCTAYSQTYCQPSANFSACAINNDFWITDVSFTGTGSTFAYSGGTCISNAPYYLNTAYQGDVVRGNTYTLSISKPGNMWKTYFNVWVDWNNNDTLNNTTPFVENIGPNMLLTASGGTTATVSVTIPATVSLGVHRMRVRVQYNVMNANNPCLTTGQAESKDFNLNVVNGCVPPTVTLTIPPSIDTVCASVGAVPLSGGTPSGGIYTGVGVNGTTFNTITAGNGTHTITYTYTDINSCSDSASATIFVKTCTGINNYYLNESSVIISPNPFTLQTTILFTDEQKNVSVRIIDILGKEVYHSVFQNTMKNITINRGDLLTGFYFLEIKSDKGVINKKIELQ